MNDVVSITRTVSDGDVRIVVRRSKIRDALKRDLFAETLKASHPGASEGAYIDAFARCITQTGEANGLAFDPLSVDLGNIEQAYTAFSDLDEKFVIRWHNAAFDINAAVDPALAPGIEVDDLKKTKTA